MAKNPNYCRFWTLAFSGVANWQQSEKVEYGCTTTNLLLSKASKSFSVLQRLHGEIGRTISGIQKRDEEADKQTDKKLNFFGRPGGGWNLSPTNLDTVTEDLEDTLAPAKLYPYHSTDGGDIWHGGGDLWSPPPCQVSPPLVSPLRGKRQNRPVSNLNTGALHCVQWCR